MTFENIEDYYTYYVCILGISERIFWDADISVVKTIAANKGAYEAWLAYKKEKMQQKMRKRR